MTGVLPTARDVDGRQLPRTYVARRRFPTRGTRTTPAESHAAIPETDGTSSSTVADAPALRESPRDEISGTPPSAGASESPRDASTTPTMASVTFGAPAAATLSEPVSETVSPLAPPRGPNAHLPNPDRDGESRFAERAVALPVTRLSDRRPREEPATARTGDRPVMQILTLGLLIAVVVLVSAAVGVLVGRWMSQH